MIAHEVQQSSADWHALRLGIPTASQFDKVLTKSGALSKQADAYRATLLAEWLMQAPVDEYMSRDMERGHDLEPEAWAYYELEHDVDVVRGGFCTNDDGTVGCSPDGRIYDGDTLAGGIELKCPRPGTHVGYLLDPASLVAAYRHQVQGTLWITGAQWWDLMSYHPLMSPCIVRVEPDAEYIEKQAEALAQFCADLERDRAALLEAGNAPRVLS